MTTQVVNPYLVPRRRVDGWNVQFLAAGVRMKAYVAREPARQRARPRDRSGMGVIVIHEDRGLVQYLRDVADGLASNGYVAIAPDLLSREGGTAAVPDVAAALAEIPWERHFQDLQVTARYLQDYLDMKRIGVIGFGFGGRLAWLLATANPDLKAAVPFSGANPPLEAVSNIRAAVYAVYGELDKRINQGIPAITKALKSANINYDMKVYPQAPHGFHNHTDPERYRAEAASQAWADALAWLSKHLKG